VEIMDDEEEEEAKESFPVDPSEPSSELARR